MNLCVGGVLQVDVNVGGSEVVVTDLDLMIDLENTLLIYTTTRFDKTC